jgi:hypothetical protein
MRCAAATRAPECVLHVCMYMCATPLTSLPITLNFCMLLCTDSLKTAAEQLCLAIMALTVQVPYFRTQHLTHVHTCVEGLQRCGASLRLATIALTVHCVRGSLSHTTPHTRAQGDFSGAAPAAPCHHCAFRALCAWLTFTHNTSHVCTEGPQRCGASCALPSLR